MRCHPCWDWKQVIGHHFDTDRGCYTKSSCSHKHQAVREGELSSGRSDGLCHVREPIRAGQPLLGNARYGLGDSRVSLIEGIAATPVHFERLH
eukprot:5779294-Pleurochrysis_carterae.AAC.1